MILETFQKLYTFLSYPHPIYTIDEVFNFLRLNSTGKDMVIARVSRCDKISSQIPSRTLLLQKFILKKFTFTSVYTLFDTNNLYYYKIEIGFVSPSITQQLINRLNWSVAQHLKYVRLTGPSTV